MISGWNFTPRAYSVLAGTRVSGTLSSVQTLNNNYLVVKSQTFGSTRLSRTEYTFSNFTGVTSASKLSFYLLAKSNSASTNGKILILNVKTNQWETLSSFTLGTTQTGNTGVVSSSLANYANSTGAVKLRVEASKLNTTTTVSTELLQLTVSP